MSIKLPTLDQFDFTTFPGVGKAIDRALKNSFSTWKELLDADPTELTAMKGITPKVANALQEQAFVTLQQARKDSLQGAEEVMALPSQVEEGVDEEGKPQTRVIERIRTEQRVDAYTVKRGRKVVRPSTCRECGWDVCEHFGLDDYTLLSPALRDRVDRHLEGHHLETHSGSGQLILTEEVRTTKPEKLDSFFARPAPSIGDGPIDSHGRNLIPPTSSPGGIVPGSVPVPEGQSMPSTREGITVPPDANPSDFLGAP